MPPPDSLDSAEELGWEEFTEGHSLAGALAVNEGAPAEGLARGWWLAYARRYAEGYLAAAVFGITEAHDDDENPHVQFSPSWEAWAAGFEDRSEAEERDDAPSYIGGLPSPDAAPGPASAAMAEVASIRRRLLYHFARAFVVWFGRWLGISLALLLAVMLLKHCA